VRGLSPLHHRANRGRDRYERGLAGSGRPHATGFAGRQSYAHTSDTSQILPRSWGLAVRELLLAARPKFTGMFT
jgi:hypothetical protein